MLRPLVDNLNQYHTKAYFVPGSKVDMEVGKSGPILNLSNYPTGHFEGFDTVTNTSEEDDPIGSIDNAKRMQVIHTTSGFSSTKDFLDVNSSDSASLALWDSHTQ
ncbi:hypothetical protein V6N11_084031 [Hibiscus sabdariffa]|uniref:Uncharacterized protein n=1 Tax=Hibiscus sabdariffa TaxID=183260 RepID=A0ABR2QDL3_9ROSI